MPLTAKSQTVSKCSKPDRGFDPSKIGCQQIDIGSRLFYDPSPLPKTRQEEDLANSKQSSSHVPASSGTTDGAGGTAEATGMELRRVEFKKLSPKQKEIYNFQKSAAVLAEYGFNCIKLADDWQGADFLAYHKDADTTLKVQLKSRLGIDKKYEGKEIWMNFPIKGVWHLVPHDTLLEFVPDAWKKSESWLKGGKYTTANPSRELREKLRPYALETARPTRQDQTKRDEPNHGTADAAMPCPTQSQRERRRARHRRRRE